LAIVSSGVTILCIKRVIILETQDCCFVVDLLTLYFDAIPNVVYRCVVSTVDRDYSGD